MSLTSPGVPVAETDTNVVDSSGIIASGSYTNSGVIASGSTIGTLQITPTSATTYAYTTTVSSSSHYMLDTASTVSLAEHTMFNSGYNMLTVEHSDGRVEKIALTSNARLTFSCEEEKELDPAMAYARAMSLIGG